MTKWAKNLPKSDVDALKLLLGLTEFHLFGKY